MPLCCNFENRSFSSAHSVGLVFFSLVDFLVDNLPRAFHMILDAGFYVAWALWRAGMSKAATCLSATEGT
jgi:hypothetical protein